MWLGEPTEYCTSGMRLLQGDVRGDTPDEVEITSNGERIAALPPPYQFLVNCDQEPERMRSFYIHARIGTQSVLSAPKFLVIDRTPPSVHLRSPGTGTGIRKDSPIVFGFSEPVRGLSSSATTLSDESGPLPHTATLSDNGYAVTLVPHAPLRVPARLQATFHGGGVSDLAGHPLRESIGRFSWRLLPFVGAGAELSGLSSTALARNPSTAPWSASRATETGDIQVRQWTGKAWMDFGPALPGDGSLVALALTRGGLPVVARVEKSGESALSVRVARWKQFVGWEDLGEPLVANPSGYSADSLSIALDSQGHPTVAWHEGFSVHVRRWTGTAWEALGPPIGDILRGASHPRVTVDSRDRVVLAYAGEPEDTFIDHVFVQLWQEGAWTRLGTRLAGERAWGINDVTLALGPDDAPFVAWIEGGAEGQVFAARWVHGAWEQAPQLGTGPIEDLSLAADTDGRMLLSWEKTEGSVLGYVWKSVYTADLAQGVWSAGTEACAGFDPVSTFTPEGAPMLWVDTGSGRYEMFLRQ